MEHYGLALPFDEADPDLYTAAHTAETVCTELERLQDQDRCAFAVDKAVAPGVERPGRRFRTIVAGYERAGGVILALWGALAELMARNKIQHSIKAYPCATGLDPDAAPLDRDDPVGALSEEFARGLDGVTERETRARLGRIERVIEDRVKGRKLYGHLYDDLLKLKYLHQRYTNYLHWLQAR